MERTVILKKSFQTIRDNQTVRITFSDERVMDELGYKVLSNVAGTNLLCGTKSVFNGKPTLTYNISEYVPLTSLYGSLTKEQVFKVIGGLLDTLEQIYDIGFLLYDNISFQHEDIFLKADSYQVYLLYMPVRNGQSILGRPSYDRMFCDFLQSILSSIPAAKSMTRFIGALSSRQTLAQLRELLHQEISDPLPEPAPEPSPEPKPRWIWPWWKPDPEVWHLVGVNTPVPVELTLAGKSFTVGRSDLKAQGLVTFNNISREHCRFFLWKGIWYLEDLKSTNGTYLNGQRLEPNKKYAVSAEDRIKLSSSEFKLRKG